MSNEFKYSILKYRHSYLLDERINIGLLFYFPKKQKLEFLFPGRLSRLKQLYPKINLLVLKAYLQNFKAKADQLLISNLTKEFLSNEFLIPDANSLFFSEIKSGTATSEKEIAEYYYKQYLGTYRSPEYSPKYTSLTNELRQIERSATLVAEPVVEYSSEKHDENYLKEKFTALLLDSKSQKTVLFEQEITIPNKFGTTKFDFGWQNGTTNLIKSISFDFSNKEKIKNQSFGNYGELSQLGEIASKSNLKFDLLVSKPRIKLLDEYYKEAIQVLSSIDSPNRIIEESDLSSYVEEAIRTIKPLKNTFL